MAIGNTIRKLRVAKNLSQQIVADNLMLIDGLMLHGKWELKILKAVLFQN